MLVAEFDCEGCGSHVFDIGRDEKCNSGFCGKCAALQEMLGHDPNAFWRAYEFLNLDPVETVAEGQQRWREHHHGSDVRSLAG